MYVCILVHIYVCMYVYVRKYVRLHVCMPCVYSACVCMYVCVCIYIHVYTCISSEVSTIDQKYLHCLWSSAGDSRFLLQLYTLYVYRTIRELWAGLLEMISDVFVI